MKVLSKTLASICFIYIFFIAQTLAAETLPNLVINDTQLMSSKRVGRTLFEYTFKAVASNQGQSVENVTALFTVSDPNYTGVDTELEFGSIGSNSETQSIDTFTIKLDRRGTTFDLSKLEFSFSGDIVSTGNPVVIPKFVASAEASPAIAMVGSDVFFDVNILQSNHAINSVRWDFSNGSVFFEKSFQTSFQTEGIITAEVTVTTSDGSVEKTEVTVPILSSATSAPSVLGLPKTPGDIDKDDALTLKDVYAISKHVSGLDLLSGDDLTSADISLDAQITKEDTLLASLAVIDGSTIPTVLLPAVGKPGTAVTIISPILQNLTEEYIVEIGNSVSAQKIFRVAPGFGNIVVPLDPVTPNSIFVDKEQQIEFNIISVASGNIVETLFFQLIPPPPEPSDPIAELNTLLNGIELAFSSYSQFVDSALDDVNLAGNERVIIEAIPDIALEEASNAIADLKKLLKEPGGKNLAIYYLKLADANGLKDFQDALTASGISTTSTPAEMALKLNTIALAVSPDYACDVAVPTLCEIKRISNLLKKLSDATSLACDLLLLAVVVAIIVPVDGPALDITLALAWVSKCSIISGALDVANVVLDLFGKPRAGLALETSTNSPSPGNPAIITPSLSFSYGPICNFAADKSLDAVLDIITKRAVGQLVRRKFKVSREQLIRIFTIGGESLLSGFFKTLNKKLKDVLKLTPADEAIGSFADKICNRLGPPGTPIIINASRVLKPLDSSLGTLKFLSNGTAEYSCPTTPASTPVKIKAEKKICKTLDKREVSLSCESQPVTITIGDNGSANDDIFEVRIDGKTVLTSSSPVRSISTTVLLPIGDTIVQMIGRAAPDGIGTYYISFSGAQLIGGDAPSGRDLTPGKIKTFTIRVQ